MYAMFLSCLGLSCLFLVIIVLLTCLALVLSCRLLFCVLLLVLSRFLVVSFDFTTIIIGQDKKRKNRIQEKTRTGLLLKTRTRQDTKPDKTGQNRANLNDTTTMTTTITTATVIISNKVSSSPLL